MASGVITLAGLVLQCAEWVEVSCNRCDRRGSLRTARLITEYALDLPVPELRHIIAADCPKMIEGKPHDVCGIHFPGLGGA